MTRNNSNSSTSGVRRSARISSTTESTSQSSAPTQTEIASIPSTSEPRRSSRRQQNNTPKVNPPEVATPAHPPPIPWTQKEDAKLKEIMQDVGMKVQKSFGLCWDWIVITEKYNSLSGYTKRSSNSLSGRAKFYPEYDDFVKAAEARFYQSAREKTGSGS